MEFLAQKNMGLKLYRFLTQRVVYHSLFWLFIWVGLTILEFQGSSYGFGFSLGNNFIRLVIFMALVYFNLNYLIPNYLTQKKFFTYCALLILTVIILTPLEAIILYFKFSDLPEAQARLLQDLNLSFLPNFFVVTSSTVFKIMSDWARQLREKQELQTKTMQTELSFLKSQINPHFLFNTLNNLYALTLKKSDKAPEIVIKLSEMMRYMLYECNEKQVPLLKEVNYIRNYLDLERLRQGKNIEIDFQVEGEVRDQRVAPLLFITFLENSFKHGLNNHLHQGFVRCHLKVDDHKVHLRIVNSKPPTLPQTTHRRSGGIGLVNVRRRLQLLYPEKHELRIRDEPNTYSVDLLLELD
ncbi:MAG: histidine kinase [Bacteroidetes bacterium]|nr:MAG: histidine kinase [Bacteroidota bacterium]